MSVSAAAIPVRNGSALLRPAIDSRPPAEQWARIGVQQVVPPNQPRLGLVEGPDESDLDRSPRAPGQTAVPVTVDLAPSGVASAQAAALTEQARTWAPWFAQLLAEAIDGRRPLESLGRWLDEWALAEVSRHARSQRRERARHQATAPVPLASVVSLRTQFTHRRVLEVAVHVRRGRRSLAWAFQLLRVGDRWRCAAVALGPAIV